MLTGALPSQEVLQYAHADLWDVLGNDWVITCPQYRTIVAAAGERLPALLTSAPPPGSHTDEIPFHDIITAVRLEVPRAEEYVAECGGLPSLHEITHLLRVDAEQELEESGGAGLLGLFGEEEEGEPWVDGGGGDY
jgi:hypothetical protein